MFTAESNVWNSFSSTASFLSEVYFKGISGIWISNKKDKACGGGVTVNSVEFLGGVMGWKWLYKEISELIKQIIKTSIGFPSSAAALLQEMGLVFDLI